MTPEGELLSLSPDELLSTTRAVRKRLDFTRPVPDEVIRDCVRLAMQAPAGSNIPRTRLGPGPRPRRARSGVLDVTVERVSLKDVPATYQRLAEAGITGRAVAVPSS